MTQQVKVDLLKHFLCSRLTVRVHAYTEYEVPRDTRYPRGILEYSNKKGTPTQVFRHVESLLGAMNWLRMYAAAREDENVGCKSFSHVIKPISTLLKSNKPGQKLAWTRDAENALQIIKERLTSETMIFHPDWNLPFTLTSDASKYAMGYALTQCVGGRTRIVRVNSKTLNDAQTRYSATEREALGVFWAINDAKVYLRGRKFTVRVDHRALTFLDGKYPKNDKVARWWNTLSMYNFLVVYIPGPDNCVADFFSRNPEQVTSRAPKENPSEPAGKTVKIGKFEVYIPSWLNIDVEPDIQINDDDLTLPETVIAHVTQNDPDLDFSVKTRICS
ncbi:unnamed protein product [Oikopleura dioica]|uniref:Reverse transcriptase RNase H-like domain-containing protein n=1 Tax=Oikopleura dioica TaxID=34765 RepID=E4XJ80_OIKDI|nr:unnamed protein product [Oikopleura dioica]